MPAEEDYVHTCALHLLDLGFWVDSKEQLSVDWGEGRERKHLEKSRSLHDKLQRPRVSVWDSYYFSHSKGETKPKASQTWGTHQYQHPPMGPIEVLCFHCSCFCFAASRLLKEPHPPL